MEGISLLRRTLAAAGASVALVLAGPASAALAHECFVANRSDKGNAAVSEHSAAWFTITPEILFNDIIGLPTPLANCAIAAWKADASLPAMIVTGGKQAVGQDGVIAANNPNFADGDKGSDGKGIEHAAAVFGPAVDQIIGGCLAG